MRSKIKNGAGTRSRSTTRHRADSQWILLRRPLFVHRERGALTRVRRHTVDRLDEGDGRIRHHDLHRGAKTATRSSAGNIESLEGVHNEHISLGTRPPSATKDRINVVDRDICALTRFLSVTIDISAHVRRQLVHRGTATVVTARHTVRVFDSVQSHLARVSGVAFARVIPNTLQLAAHSVLDDALQIELAEGARSVSGTVQLPDVDAIDIRAHTRQVTVAIEGGSVGLIADHFDVFHSKTAGITVANNVGAVGPANHFSAETAVEIVDALDLAVGRLLEHPHFGAFIRIIPRLRSAVLSIGSGLADLVALGMRFIDHVLGRGHGE